MIRNLFWFPGSSSQVHLKDGGEGGDNADQDIYIRHVVLSCCSLSSKFGRHHEVIAYRVSRLHSAPPRLPAIHKILKLKRRKSFIFCIYFKKKNR